MTYDYAIFFVFIIVSIVIGYILGRNSAGQPVSSQPRTFNQGSGRLNDPDPYQEALEPDEKPGKRIATVT